LVKKYPLATLKLKIIGSGTERENLIKLIELNNLSTKINMLGELPHSQIPYQLNTLDVFISHNTAFDFYVLLNELYRIKQLGTIKKLMQIKKNKDVICTCKHSGYKRLGNIYKSIFNCDVNVAHRAGDDVKTLIEILIKKQINDTTYITQMN
jgi:hypothetical protein